MISADVGHIGGVWASEDVSLHDVIAARLRLAKAGAGIGNAYSWTRVLTVVAITRQQQERLLAKEILMQVSKRFPLTAIIILLEPDADVTRIDAEVSTYTSNRGTEQAMLMYEAIVLNLKGEVSRHVSSVIRPLVSSDTPVFLWWLKDSYKEFIVARELVEIALRSLTDTSYSEDPSEALATMLAFQESFCEKCSIVDLAFSATQPQRMALATAFDIQPLRISSLVFDQITVADSGPSTRPFYLAGWLCHSLGLTPTEKLQDNDSVRLFSLRSGLGSCTLKISFDETQNISPRIGLRGKSDDSSWTISLLPPKRVDAMGLIRIAEVGGPVYERPILLKAWTDAEKLESELEYYGEDKVFSGVLSIARVLAE